MIALAGVGAFMVWGLASIGDEHALAASPVCPQWQTSPSCRAEMVESVDGIDIDTSDHHVDVSLYLYGSTPELGWVNLDSGDATFARALQRGDTVTAEVWRGKVVAVSANGQTATTDETPETDAHIAVWGLAVAGLLAFTLLRSASRTRLWNRLGFEPRGDAPEVRFMWTYGFVVAVVGVVGTILFGFEIAVWWAAALITLSAIGVVYGLLFPWVLPSAREAFLSYPVIDRPR